MTRTIALTVRLLCDFLYKVVFDIGEGEGEVRGEGQGGEGEGEVII